MWNRSVTAGACSDYAARLEMALEAAGLGRPQLAPDLAEHLESCEGCRSAFEDAEVARVLLHSALTPSVPPLGFGTRVLAAIRAEQASRAAQGNIFWRPLEHLAAKAALAAATVVMLMSLYVYGFMPRNSNNGGATQDQVYTLVPQPENQQPATPDEVLMYLAEGGHGR